MSLDEELLIFAKEQSLINLLESGVDVNFIQPLIERLNTAVANGENINDLMDELQTMMISSKENNSLLKRYVSQVASDSITQFNAVHTQILAQGTKIEFYYYDGTKIAKTRPFCATHQQKYYHYKEVQNFGDGIDVDGRMLTADQFKGRISGTNKSNIFINRGGWNCRHQFAPASIFSTPKEVVQRALDKGFIKLSDKQKNALGL